MREAEILYPGIAKLLCLLGQGYMPSIANAGLPIPRSIGRIDLALDPGDPSLLGFLAVLDVVLAELVVEWAEVVGEARERSPGWLSIRGKIVKGGDRRCSTRRDNASSMH